jgi:hypothetical protein
MNMQIINVIKVDVSLNQLPDSSISSFVNNLVTIPNKPIAIRTYPVGFALIQNPLLRPSFENTQRNSFGSKSTEAMCHLQKFYGIFLNSFHNAIEPVDLIGPASLNGTNSIAKSLLPPGWQCRLWSGFQGNKP